MLRTALKYPRTDLGLTFDAREAAKQQSMMSAAGNGDHRCNWQNSRYLVSPVLYVRRVFGAIAIAA